MTEINWKTSKHDFDLISHIADRSAALAGRIGLDYPVRAILMDLTAVHANGNPLDLHGLLNAEPSDFGHDILGIRKHINRENGRLENCFVPRYSK